ncbi:MAG: DUF695 domain-containing protein [Bacteroidales bacterium]|nr:DUF695 domain-containing protein [Bacteroidales bacterium]
MRLTDKWFTAISQDEKERLITVTGRDDVMEFVRSGKFKERVEITWKFEGNHQGMPSEELAAQMEQVELVLRKVMEDDKLAIMTAIYTGGDQKTWVFYCRTIRVFGERVNEALAGFPLLPIEIYTEVDPQWEEYLDMLEMKEWDE